MKALIVDDEKASVVAARLLVDWERFDIDTVYEVDCSEDVLPLIRSEEIQVVLSDVRMPGISGLELIEEIRRVRPHTQIIMMSGFGQFEYVRKALQEGCVDYILKPIEEEQINRAVEKAVQAWKREVSLENIEHSYQEINSELNKKQAQRLLMICLNSDNWTVAYDELAGLMPFLGRIKSCRMAHISTRHLREELLTGERDTTLLADWINERLCREERGLAVTRRVNSNIYLFLDAASEGLQDFLTQLLRDLQEKTGICFGMGVSDAFPVREAFTRAAPQARKRSRNCPLEKTETGELQDRDAVFSVPDLSAWEDELHKAALSSYPHVIRTCAERLTEWMMEDRPLTIEKWESFRQQYMRMRIRWVEGFRQNRSGKGEKPLEFPVPDIPLPFDDRGIVSGEMLARLLEKDLTCLADLFRESVGKGEEENVIFQQIEQYILLHFTEKISIGQLSRQFAISESYLSRSFKKQTGMGIPDYINRLRIEKAKELMMNPDMKISEISWMVGYTDEKYMSRVFHRLTGCSPQAFRSRQEGKHSAG